MKVKLQWMNKSSRRVGYNTHCHNCFKHPSHMHRNVGYRVVMKGDEHIRIAHKEVMVGGGAVLYESQMFLFKGIPQ